MRELSEKKFFILVQGLRIYYNIIFLILCSFSHPIYNWVEGNFLLYFIVSESISYLLRHYYVKKANIFGKMAVFHLALVFDILLTKVLLKEFTTITVLISTVMLLILIVIFLLGKESNTMYISTAAAIIIPMVYITQFSGPIIIESFSERYYTLLPIILILFQVFAFKYCVKKSKKIEKKNLHEAILLSMLSTMGNDEAEEEKKEVL